MMERPEYGYATYFFELVESLPISWQIKRLVIAMKLTNCSRISLLENRPLLVITIVIIRRLSHLYYYCYGCFRKNFIEE